MSNTTTDGTIVTSEKTRLTLDEDWAVVVLGFIIIFLFLGGMIIPAPTFKWNSAHDLSSTVFSPNNLLTILYQFILVFVFSALASVITNKPVKASLKVFPVLYIISVLALILEGNAGIKSLNLEAVIFSLSIGLLIGNLFSLPAWFKSALNAEMFVKIGLVLLGTRIIFSELLKAGSLGIIQALIVVLTVWYFAFWVCKKLKLDEDLRMMISSAVSICGVSAAIATAGAIKGDPKKLSYVISLVLVTAIPMMIFMPYIAKLIGLSQDVTGAWIGGTIDTTGAVVAAGSLVGDQAVQISTIVKFSQNVLLGLAAFAISIYWTYTQRTPEGMEGNKPSLGLLWERFPKFVLGFVAASVLFSFILDPSLVEATQGGLKSIQTLWFVLAFTSIGLETRFSDLFKADNKRPLYAFLIAQTFNIIVTLIVAYLLFG
ncbi:MAG TPA: putative sulfate exporter family transporter [Chryseosolibacter sp.]|nr:putative sulfate exporter family transporter [Chryseosolibacter sp.]